MEVGHIIDVSLKWTDQDTLSKLLHTPATKRLSLLEFIDDYWYKYTGIKTGNECSLSVKVRAKKREGNMDRKETILELIKKISFEVLGFIKEEGKRFPDRWVPAAHIKNSLELNFIAVPKANKQYGEKGWFFAIVARMLEEQNLLEYKKSGGRAYYRSII